jgi:hypothetical protein
VPPDALRDPTATSNPMTVAQLQNLTAPAGAGGAADFEWALFFAQCCTPRPEGGAGGDPALTPASFSVAELAAVERLAINVDVPAFFTCARVLLTRSSPQTLAAYAKWRALVVASPLLSAPFRRAHWEFFARDLAGVRNQTERGRACVASLGGSDALGELAGRYFVAEAFSGCACPLPRHYACASLAFDELAVVIISFGEPVAFNTPDRLLFSRAAKA